MLDGDFPFDKMMGKCYILLFVIVTHFVHAKDGGRGIFGCFSVPLVSEIVFSGELLL